MANFPSLIPSSRIFTPGEYPHTPYQAISGIEGRVRHSNAMLSATLRLAFISLSESDMLSILSHYNGQQGGFIAFAIPSQLLNGVSAAADYTLSGHQWRYVQPPIIDDIPCAGHSVELTLESVPPEAVVLSGLAGLTSVISATIISGPATVANGVQLEFATAFVGGVAGTTGADLTIIANIEGGAATGGSGATDPDFASVSLLLHMEGSNGSTTFTDNSVGALSVTANGNAQISTSQSKFGSASGIFDGAGDYLNTPASAAFNFGSSPFTVECWFRPADVTQSDRSIFSQRIGGVYAPFEIRVNTTAVSWLISNAAVNDWSSTGNSTTGILSANTWHHAALVGNGSSLTLYIDGTSRLTTSQPSWASANRTMYIGSGGDGAYNGYIDEFRVTKGIARYTANFTPPTAAFPDS